MKKVALSLLAFALVGAGAFADAAADVVKSPVTFSLNVSGQAQWGVDLDTNVHGFDTAATANINLWFLNGSSEKTGDGDTHGYIKVADVKLGFDDKGSSSGAAVGQANPLFSIGAVTAKIVSGDLYIKLWENTNASVGYSRDVDNDNGGSGTSANDTFKTYAGTYGGDSEWNDSAISGYSLFDGEGIEVGYTIPSTLSLVFAVDSAASWTAASQSKYEVSAAANLLSVEKLTVGGKFYYTDGLTAAGAEFAYDLGVAAPFANVNFNVTTSKYTADFGSKLSLVDGLAAVVWGQYNSESVFNASATFSLAEAKLAGPLSADVGVRIKDLTKAVATNAFTEIFGKVGFKASDVIKAYASVSTYNGTIDNTTNVVAATTDSSLFLKAGVDFTGISLTTISLNWDSSDLGALKATGASKTGKLVVTAKVAY
jgi:hypothetical protein